MTRDRSISRKDFKPDCCPECGNWDIDGGSVDIEGQEARQEVSCVDCKAIWLDVYRIERRYIANDTRNNLRHVDYTIFITEETS